jgi:hypothetical protein
MIRKLLQSKSKPWIEFSPEKKELTELEKPVPSGKKIPHWFRKLPKRVQGMSVSEAGTVKSCVPFLDALSQGFIIPLWCDLLIDVDFPIILYDANGVTIDIVMTKMNTDDLIGLPIGQLNGTDNATIITHAKRSDELEIHCKMSDDEISHHAWEQVGNLCDLKKFKFGKNLRKLNNPWCIKTPKGWSVQIKNPANNFENDIHILEGVVDTDEYGVPILFPFVWTGSERGEFIIPKGTPIAQVIPFKREKVNLIISDVDEQSTEIIHSKMRSRIKDRYKLEFWHKRKKSE